MRFGWKKSETKKILWKEGKEIRIEGGLDEKERWVKGGKKIGSVCLYQQHEQQYGYRVASERYDSNTVIYEEFSQCGYDAIFNKLSKREREMFAPSTFLRYT